MHSLSVIVTLTTTATTIQQGASYPESFQLQCTWVAFLLCRDMQVTETEGEIPMVDWRAHPWIPGLSSGLPGFLEILSDRLALCGISQHQRQPASETRQSGEKFCVVRSCVSRSSQKEGRSLANPNISKYRTSATYIMSPTHALDVTLPCLPVRGKPGVVVGIGRVLCVGKNFAAHARELGCDPEKEPPVFFTKTPDCVVAAKQGEVVAVGWQTAPWSLGGGRLPA